MYLCIVMAIVYQHRRLDTNDIFYIGIGKTEKRAYSLYGRNPIWKSIVKKSGYKVEIIHNEISRETACELEKFYIQKYGRKDLGLGLLVNLTDGGEGLPNLSPEIKKEHSLRVSKTRIESGVAKGVNNPMYGKIGELSPHYGKKRPEHSLVMKGKSKPEGFSEKCRINKTGEKNLQSKLKDIDIIWIKNNFIKHHIQYGLTPISKKYNVSIATISNIVNNKKWKHI